MDSKNKIAYIKRKKKNTSEMKKKSEKNFQNIQVDPINGNYYIVIPEWIVNELSWYEDTEVSLSIEGGDLVITENKE